jgi:hypothetical protein
MVFLPKSFYDRPPLGILYRTGELGMWIDIFPDNSLKRRFRRRS